MLQILVVDDCQADRQQLANMLEEYACDIIEASTGENAIQILQTQPIDFVFMDVVMPALDGFSALKKIKRLPEFKDLPVILMRENMQQSDAFRGKQLGASGMLSKPVKKSDILQYAQPLLKEKLVIDFKEKLDSDLPGKLGNNMVKTKV